MSEKLKVGIIGVGAIAKVHANAYAATGEVDIAAICDIDETKLAAMGGQWLVEDRFTDFRSLLKADVVAVTPLGYPASPVSAPTKQREPLDRITSWDRGGPHDA